MRFFLFFLIICCNSCITNNHKDIYYKELNHSEKFIIRGKQSRIIYTYWQEYLKTTSEKQCIDHFKASIAPWKNQPNVNAALQITFLQFCKVHKLKYNDPTISH